MKEETLLILKHINSKIEEVKEEHNIDNDICFVIPIGSYADYGYVSHEMIKDILQTQQRIDKARKYLKDREEDNDCCSVCSVMSDRLLEILGGKE